MRDKVTKLVPLDGSKLAEHALAFLPLLMPLGLESVELVSVVAYDADHRRRPGEDIDREKNLLTAYLDGVAQDLRDATALRVEPKVLLGRPATSCAVAMADDAGEAIIDAARSGQYDLIAMATRGRGGLSELVQGSTASKVVRSGVAPVVLVRPSGD